MEYSWIDVGSTFYPDSLLELSKPPKRLYYMGDISLLQDRCIGIVGSRKCSGYGRWFALTMARRAASLGFNVVSGMASGVDTYSHLGALEIGKKRWEERQKAGALGKEAENKKRLGTTIAVLGCGIERCYPAGNYGLKKDIGRYGLVLSEFEPAAPPARWTFPQRNRIIAALSNPLIVGEAGLNSGAMITAGQAMDLGRIVYALPGNINTSSSLGSNRLIYDGALIIATIDDPFIEMKIPIQDPLTGRENLSQLEEEILSLLEEEGEISTEDLSRRLGKPIAEVNAKLSLLEMKGLISNSLGRIIANWEPI